MPILCDSFTYSTILSVLSFSLVNNAHINSIGKFAFRYAVLYEIKAYAAEWLRLKPYPEKYSIKSNILFASDLAMPLLKQPRVNSFLMRSITSGIFLLIARLK